MYGKQDLKSDQRFKASFRCLKVFWWQELFVSTLQFDKCPYPSHKDLSLSSTVHGGKLQHRWMAPVLVCPGITPFCFKWQERTDSSNSLWPRLFLHLNTDWTQSSELARGKVDATGWHRQVIIMSGIRSEQLCGWVCVWVYVASADIYSGWDQCSQSMAWRLLRALETGRPELLQSALLFLSLLCIP